MKVIVRTETKLGSGMKTDIYIPSEGVEYAPEEYYRNTLDKLYKSDLDIYREQIEESEIDHDYLTAHIYAGDYSIVYETVEVKAI